MLKGQSSLMHGGLPGSVLEHPAGSQTEETQIIFVFICGERLQPNPDAPISLRRAVSQAGKRRSWANFHTSHESEDMEPSGPVRGY